MVGGTGRKGVRVRRLAVTDRGDEPVFIVGLFCILFFIDGKGVVKEAVFVLELDVMIYFESGSPFFYLSKVELITEFHGVDGGNVRGLDYKGTPGAVVASSVVVALPFQRP